MTFPLPQLKSGERVAVGARAWVQRESSDFIFDLKHLCMGRVFASRHKNRRWHVRITLFTANGTPEPFASMVDTPRRFASLRAALHWLEQELLAVESRERLLGEKRADDPSAPNYAEWPL